MPTINLVTNDSGSSEAIFDCLWNTFDRKYGLFVQKRIKWDSLYGRYRPLVNKNTTEDKLFEICSALLSHLKDKHVWLESRSKVYNYRLEKPCEIGQVELRWKSIKAPFSSELIQTKYLNNDFDKIDINSLYFGFLTDSIGYFHLSSFDPDLDSNNRALDQVINRFKETKGLIIDIRDNRGGSDLSAKKIADRFADRKRLYMYSQIRNGPKHNDYTAPFHWYIEPTGRQYLKPIVLLTNKDTFSASETFTLAMRVIPHVTSLGDTTAGALSDAEDGTLPNGWRFTYSIGVWRDYEGKLFEEIGIPPDVQIPNTFDDVSNGHDRVLEFAVEFLQKEKSEEKANRH